MNNKIITILCLSVMIVMIHVDNVHSSNNGSLNINRFAYKLDQSKNNQVDTALLRGKQNSTRGDNNLNNNHLPQLGSDSSSAGMLEQQGGRPSTRTGNNVSSSLQTPVLVPVMQNGQNRPETVGGRMGRNFDARDTTSCVSQSRDDSPGGSNRRARKQDQTTVTESLPLVSKKETNQEHGVYFPKKETGKEYEERLTKSGMRIIRKVEQSNNFGRVKIYGVLYPNGFEYWYSRGAEQFSPEIKGDPSNRR